jgi:hypothetical protein
VLFEKGTGAFDPVISDGTDVYLTGDTGLYGLEPAEAAAAAARTKAAVKAKRSQSTSPPTRKHG